MNERSSVHGEDDRTCRPSLYAKSVASSAAEAIESFDQTVATLVGIGGAQKHVLVSRVRPSCRFSLSVAHPTLIESLIFGISFSVISSETTLSFAESGLVTCEVAL
jgi:hypothetical protein